MTYYNDSNSTAWSSSSKNQEDNDVIGTITTKYVMELKDLLSTSRWVRIEYNISMLPSTDDSPTNIMNHSLYRCWMSYGT